MKEAGLITLLKKPVRATYCALPPDIRGAGDALLIVMCTTVLT